MSHMYIMAYDDMFRSDSTNFRSLRAMYHATYSSKYAMGWDPIYIARCTRYIALNTLRTGAFKLFKCTFPGSKHFKSNFILCFFKYL